MAGGNTNGDRLNRITVCRSRRRKKRRCARSACGILLSDLGGPQRSLRWTGHQPAALAGPGRHVCSVSPLTAITARSVNNRAVDRVACRLAPPSGERRGSRPRVCGGKTPWTATAARATGAMHRDGPGIASRPRCATYSI